ncbi:pilus (MSHA type) biogenesis protein MshL [Pseudoduganella sp. DS3]|uniref:Type IV pilus biogenesis and competence protein PilQ n=1 Tax=Pseudoduganella guangdongensis TaxID=2692179 RepID=A0A6N9HLK2_9BURK|nr:pilus (MSHA type) biogenesis protein MshL [Pseudoduganella guangdongensis]MYN03832.1 pilus (MSHA type) biogenesis protein MshL [Pseudoduganella guangdongensis]
MKNLTASLLCVLLGACAAPQLPVSPAHVGEPAPVAGAIPEPVQHSAPLPSPRPAQRQETYSVSVHRVPVQSVLFALARDAGLNVDVHPAIEGMVTLNALDQTLPQLLARIGKQVDMRYELQGKNLVVLPDQPYWHHYRVDYVNIARSTNSSVNIATQISTTGGSAVGGTASNPVPSAGMALGGGNNNSTTSVTNRSDNNFWFSLEKNVRDMLRPTTLGDSLSDPLAQMREQASALLQQAQSQGAGGPEGGYPGAQATAAQARTAAGATAFGPGAAGQVRGAASVIANPEGGLLSVRATSRQHEKVQEFLDLMLSAAKRQVLIEATIIEVKLSDQYQQGINWSRINGHGKLGQGRVGTAPLPSGILPGTSPGFFIFDYSNPVTRFGNISATISLLESFGKVKVLSSPRISVLNNQTALLKVVDNNIFFTLKVTPAVLTSNGTIATPATYESKVETVPVGFVMSVTPQISADDEVTLNVRPTITRIVDSVEDPNPELHKQGVISRVPVIQAREMESVLKVQSGQVAVMGGLMQDSVDNAKDGIPWVSSLPVVGNLFSYRNETASKTELVIFLRPVVVKDASIAGDFRDYRHLMPNRPAEGL